MNVVTEYYNNSVEQNRTIGLAANSILKKYIKFDEKQILDLTNKSFKK